MQELLRPHQTRSLEGTQTRPNRRPGLAAGGGFPAVRRFEFLLTVLVLIIGLVVPRCHCFTALNMHRNHVVISGVHLLRDSTSSSSSDGMATSSSADDVIARRITVVGDVGGYYRACVINEVRMADALFFLCFLASDVATTTTPISVRLFCGLVVPHYILRYTRSRPHALEGW
jgi:hypothetical protein